MKCETVQDNLVLLIYGELADDARFLTEKHLEGCSECSQEWQDLRQFHANAGALPYTRQDHRVDADHFPMPLEQRPA